MEFKNLRFCERCHCPGHLERRCPVFIPNGEDDNDYINEIQRIKKLGLTPITNENYIRKWIKKNGGSRSNIKLIYKLIQDIEICFEDQEIINLYT